GEFYVDRSCIDCDTCRRIAPDVFAEGESFSYVGRQPASEQGRLRALMALVACPTASIGTASRLPAAPAVGLFPEPIDGGVYFCGFTSKDSFGAWSYLIRRPAPGGNVLVARAQEPVRLPRRLLVLLGGTDPLHGAPARLSLRVGAAGPRLAASRRVRRGHALRAGALPHLDAPGLITQVEGELIRREADPPRPVGSSLQPSRAWGFEDSRDPSRGCSRRHPSSRHPCLRADDRPCLHPSLHHGHPLGPLRGAPRNLCFPGRKPVIEWFRAECRWTPRAGHRSHTGV